MMELYAGFNSEKNEKDIRRFILPDSQKRYRTFEHDREVLWTNTDLDGQQMFRKLLEALLNK
jgi:hypothetical protein